MRSIEKDKLSLTELQNISNRALNLAKRDMKKLKDFDYSRDFSFKELMESYSYHLDNLAKELKEKPLTKKEQKIATSNINRVTLPPSKKVPKKIINDTAKIDIRVKEKGTYAVFICHADEDRPLAIHIKQLLKDFNVNSFVAHADIEKGEIWEPTILDTLGKSKVVLVLGSKFVEDSAWVNFETGLGYKKMFPLLFGRLSDKVTYIKGKQGIIVDYEDIPKTITALIYEVLSKLGITTDKTDETIISLKSFKQLEAHITKKYSTNS